MVLGLEASSVSDSTPLLDSDDLMQTLWLFPIVVCWQGHSFFFAYHKRTFDAIATSKFSAQALLELIILLHGNHFQRS